MQRAAANSRPGTEERGRSPATLIAVVCERRAFFRTPYGLASRSMLQLAPLNCWGWSVLRDAPSALRTNGRDEIRKTSELGRDMRLLCHSRAVRKIDPDRGVVRSPFLKPWWEKTSAGGCALVHENVNAAVAPNDRHLSSSFVDWRNGGFCPPEEVVSCHSARLVYPWRRSGRRRWRSPSPLQLQRKSTTGKDTTRTRTMCITTMRAATMRTATMPTPTIATTPAMARVIRSSFIRC